jgi:hypothetical protein
MTRARDVIEVSLEQPTSVGMDVAWSDLRAVIYSATGFDIDRGNHFAVRTMPIRGTGNRVTRAFVAVPRDAQTPEQMMKLGFCSLFGELPLWATDITREAAKRCERPIFAVPLETAMRV